MDDAEFAEFMHARWHALLRAARALGCTPTEADDVVQTALVKCYLAWDKVVAADNRDAYVGRILVNAHRDTFRRGWRRESPTDELPDDVVADRTGAVDTADAVGRALAGLSVDARRVVALRFHLGLNETEISRALGVPVGTVKSRLSRAIARLSENADLMDLRDGGPA